MKRKKYIGLIAIIVGTGMLMACAKNEPVPVEKKEKAVIEIPEEYLAEKHPMSDGFAGGDGTEENPYQISNAEELTYWAESINHYTDYHEATRLAEAYYVLTDDIEFNDLSDFDNWSKQAPRYRWEAVGCKTYVFTGSFDGNGHTISGLYMVESGNDWENASDSERCAFIASLLGDKDKKGVVKNLYIDKSYYRCLEGSLGAAGVVLSMNKGTVENCVSNVTIDYKGDITNVGGIVGSSFDSNIANCVFEGMIYTFDKAYAAGIVGDFAGNKLADCVNRGTLVSDKSAYGIAGTVSALTDFVSTSDKAGSWDVEGYHIPTNTFIQNCVNYSDLQGVGLIGGVNAGSGNIYVEDCINYGNIDGIAGLIGRLDCNNTYIGNNDRIPGYAVVRNCINKGSVTGMDKDAVGGCIAMVFFYANIEIDSCVNEGTVEGISSAGGVIGSIQASQSEDIAEDSELIVTNCVNYGEVRANESAAGGIVGNADFYLEEQDIEQSVIIENNTNEGSVTGYGHGVGGILGAVLGMHGGEGDKIVLENNKNNADIYGLMPAVTAGGIAGYYAAGEQEQVIKGCTNAGKVIMLEDEENPIEISGDVYYGIAGGIVGAMQEKVVLENNSFTGAIEIPDGYKEYVIGEKEVAYIMETGDDMITFIKD